MTGPALLALLSHWRQHRFQLAALIVGLALATALWMAVQAINSQAKASYAKAANYARQIDRPSLVSATNNLTVSDYVSLKRSGWKLSPILTGNIKVAGQSIEITGVDLLSPPPISGIMPPEMTAQDMTAQDGEILISMLRPPGGLLLHPQTAQRIAAEFPALTLHRSAELPPGHAIGDISVVSRLLDAPKTLTRLIYLPSTPPHPSALQTLPDHIQFEAANASRVEPGTLTESFHLNLTAFGFLSFVVGLFIVQGTIGLAMEQRRGLFRTLRCLGLPFANLVLILLIEITFIAFISAFIGLIIGYFIAASLLPGVAVTLSGLYGVEVDNGLTLQPAWVLSGLAMTLLGAAVASGYSFFTLWHLPILQAPSTQARGQQILRNFNGWARAGVGLLGIGALSLLLWGGLNGGFAFLGCLMLGTALLLPFCLWHILQAGQRLTHHPLGHWLWADARAQLPGLSLALMALMLALATNIGVGTMVSSFRLTFTGWLDQRLSSELYVTARDDAQGAALEQWLAQKDLRVLPIRSQVLRDPAGQISIYGVRDDPTYRDHWPMLESQPRAWDLLATGQGILISEQLARRRNLSLGDTILLPQGWPSNILGIYSDYGNPHGQAIVSMAQLLRNAPEAPNQRFGLRLDARDVPALIEEIQETFDLDRENLVEQGKLKAASQQVFDQTFRVTDSLKLLTLGVASFAIFTSLATLWSQRLPQLGPIWAIGVSRRTLAQIDILRSLLMAGLTALLALPLGLVLSWALLVVINTEAFGWRLPIYLFPLDWLWLVILSLLAALLAALLPAWRLFRLQPSALLKVFSSER
ncbi:ABC transporter permease [Pseudophaeobacter arcticus]|uniref:ABC transporter permease n=1 Tax=Pseudophaeobacter arcticus TaxID=385492 RepID=A0ABQ0AQL6_9RHOB